MEEKQNRILLYLGVFTSIFFECFLIFLPVLFSFHLVDIFVKILMIIGTFVAFLILIIGEIITFIIKRKMSSEEYELTRLRKGVIKSLQIVIGFLILLVIYNSLLYFSPNVWGTFEIVFPIGILIAISLSIYTMLDFVKSIFNGEKLMMFLFSVAVELAMLWIGLPENETLLKVALGILYCELIGIILNATLGANQHKNIRHNKVLLMSLFVVGVAGIIITFPFYINWCGLKDENFTTFVQVYSALVGGGLTLAGVAWTIKKGNEQKKEEERKANIPYIKIQRSNESNALIVCDELKREIYNTIDPDAHEIINNKTVIYLFMIKDFIIKNVTDSILILKRLILDEKEYNLSGDVLIEKDCAVRVCTTENYSIYCFSLFHNMYLESSDSMGNHYLHKCEFDTSMDGYGFDIEGEKKTCRGCHYTITVTNILLPVLKEEKRNEHF